MSANSPPPKLRLDGAPFGARVVTASPQPGTEAEAALEEN